MVSVLRTLQAEWNALVPQAEALNIRRVRPLNAPLESIAYRQGKVDWLRGEIARLTATTVLTPTPVPDAVLEYALDLRTFGVELEFIMPAGMTRHRIAELLQAVGVRCEAENYNHNTGPHWKIITDGSLGDYARGAELVSPPLRGEEGLVQLGKACEVLKGIGCKVTKKCGLHVHVGVQHEGAGFFKNLVRLYASAEKAIDSFMSPSRRGSDNDYCQPLRYDDVRLQRATTVDLVAQAMGQSPGRINTRSHTRYRKLNLMSFWQHGTVEFRHHQGTIERDKAINWTKLCLRMCAAAFDNVQVAPVTLDDLLTHTRTPAGEADYFRGRVEYFQTQLNRAAQRNGRAANLGNRRLAGLQYTMEDAARVNIVEEVVRERAEQNTAAQVVRERIAQERANRLTQLDQENPYLFTADELQRRSTTRGS